MPDNRGMSVERRREVTRTAIREFEEALAALDEARDPGDPWNKPMREAIESQLVDLRAELAELEAAETETA